MTYREHMHGCATALAEMIELGARVPAHDLDLALTAHALVVQSVSVLYQGVTGVTRPGNPTIDDLDNRPVNALSHYLREQATHPVLAPSVVAVAPSSAAPTRRWQSAAVHALLAATSWQDSEPRSRPRGDAVWSEVADLSAITLAVCRVSADLDESVHDAGRADVTPGQIAARPGLATAARAVADLAARGALPPGSVEQVVPRPTGRPVLVRNLDDAGPGLQRLTHLLGTAELITPSDTQLIARTLALSARLSADTLGAFGAEYEQAHQALGRLADALADVVATRPRAAALIGGEGLELVQAQQVHQMLSKAYRTRQPLTEDQALIVGAAGVQAAHGLTAKVGWLAESGRWVFPVDNAAAGTPDWGHLRDAADRPKLLIRSRRAWLRANEAVASLAPHVPSIGKGRRRGYGGTAPGTGDTRSAPARRPMAHAGHLHTAAEPWPAPRDILATTLSTSPEQQRPPRPPRPSMPVTRTR